MILAVCLPLPDTLTVEGIKAETDTIASASLDIRQKKWYSPHFASLQFAGNIGFISLGAGYSTRSGDYQISLLYSYTPASTAGIRVHTITAKNIFNIYPFNIDDRHTLIPYIGLALSLEAGGRSFFFQPSHMPKGYYNFPKSIHLIASGGLKLQHMSDKIKPFRGIEFVAELTTVDAYIWYKVISDEVKMSDIMSLGLGINFLLK